VERFLEEYGLIAVFVSLVTTPVGNPIPEDVSLFFAGAMAKNFDRIDIVHALIYGYLGVTIGDSIAWAMGRRVGLHPTGFLARMIGPKGLGRVEGFYKRWGSWAIVICRQFPGFRLPCFFFAGASGMRFEKFIAVDGTAALITTNVFVWLGYTLVDFEKVEPWLTRFRHIAFLLVAVIACIVIYGIVNYQIELRKNHALRLTEE
jgi:membrane protein DedA with SNARE-associated domain